MARTIAAAVIGAVLGMIMSLIVLGDDGPGFEAKHAIMALVGLVVAVVVQRTVWERRSRR
ncbi:hypothetical protein AB0M36_22950 [Actinoplanes sp. NPDC051346]|uniref:hypothetical protein n=1 Tax=Actinoplanes sp. NPDC051346 TaxID=3155048 RepID=UPI0034204378